MRKRGLSKKSCRELLMWQYTVRCKLCKGTATWDGRCPDAHRYYCGKCKRRMEITHTQQCSRAEADLTLKYQDAFSDKCHDCSRNTKHRVRYDADLDAYFLHCKCGEELRQVETEEL